jgi:hypothetical protein
MLAVIVNRYATLARPVEMTRRWLDGVKLVEELVRVPEGTTVKIVSTYCREGDLKDFGVTDVLEGEIHPAARVEFDALAHIRKTPEPQPFRGECATCHADDLIRLRCSDCGATIGDECAADDELLSGKCWYCQKGMGQRAYA